MQVPARRAYAELRRSSRSDRLAADPPRSRPRSRGVRTLQGASALRGAAAGTSPTSRWRGPRPASRVDLRSRRSSSRRGRRGAARRGGARAPAAGPLHDALTAAAAAARRRRRGDPRRTDALLWRRGARALSLGASARGRGRGPHDPVLILDRAEAISAIACARRRAPCSATGSRRGRLLAGKMPAGRAAARAPRRWCGRRGAAAGRLAANLSAVRRLMFTGTRRRRRGGAGGSPRRSRRCPRAPAPTAGSIASHRVLDPETRKRDPWLVAALGVAAPHLARERPEWWGASRRRCPPTRGPSWLEPGARARRAGRRAPAAADLAEVSWSPPARARGRATPRSTEDAAALRDRGPPRVGARRAAARAPVPRALDHRSRWIDGARRELPVPLACFERR